MLKIIKMKMFCNHYIRLYHWRMLVLAFLLLMVNACNKKDYNATPAQPSLITFIGQENNLSIFRAALKRTGLDSILNSGGPYTIFAPADSAFTAAGLTADVVNNYDKQALRNILSFHIIPGRIGSATVTGFISDSMQSLNANYSPIITQNYYGLFLNGVKIIKGNIVTTDGVLHEINAVSFPPANNLLQTLDRLPNTKMAAYIFHKSLPMSIFATDPGQFFKKLGPNESGFQLQMNTGGITYNSCTFLIPSDDAFKKYGYTQPSDLDQLDSASRNNLLVTGILMGSLFTSDFVGGRYVGGDPSATVNGNAPIRGYGTNANSSSLVYHTYVYNPRLKRYVPKDIYYNMFNNSGNFEFSNDGLGLIGAGIATQPRLIQTNILATNGVLHITDQIFAPSSNISGGGPN